MNYKLNEDELKNLYNKFPILQYFAYNHLPENLKSVSAPFAEIALDMAYQGFKNPAETAAGLRKLLEAKDCFVRAAL